MSTSLLYNYTISIATLKQELIALFGLTPTIHLIFTLYKVENRHTAKQLVLEMRVKQITAMFQ